MNANLVSAEVLMAYGVALAMVGSVVIARAVQGGFARMFHGYSVTHEIVKNNNSALGIRGGAFFLGAVMALAWIAKPSGIGHRADLDMLGASVAIVIAVLTVSQYVNDRMILFDYHNNDEVVGKNNMAVATVEASTLFATAMITAGALSGWHGGFLVSLVWLGIGQLFLIALSMVYRLLMPELYKALREGNQSCAFSLGGVLLSGGILLAFAISGPFNGWGKDLRAVLIYMVPWVILMAVSHYVLNRLLLRGSHLKDEMIRDNNTGAGFMDAMISLSVTVAVVAVATFWAVGG